MTPITMHVGAVELVYAQALLDLAQEQGLIDEIAEEMQQLGGLIEAQPGLVALLENQMISQREKSAALERIFEGRVSDLLWRFIVIANRKNRMGLLPGIVRGFQLLMEERHGVVEVQAFTAYPLDEGLAQAIVARLGQALNRQVVLRQQVDASLIGGLKIRLGDQIYDATIATQLRLLRERLIEAGREKASLSQGWSSQSPDPGQDADQP